MKNLRLSPVLYVEKKLLDSAVTGPCCLDSNGAAWAHRRRPLRQDNPAAAEPSPAAGWYQVTAVAEYLPPWEALVHKKCGLYQEYYMVRWGPPFDKIDYSNTEHGGEGPGTTWEPDECLPDTLDELRTSAKKAWLAQAQKRELREKEELAVKRSASEKELIKRVSAESGDQDAGAEKTRRTDLNPKRLKLCPDVSHPSVGHVVSSLPKSTDEAMIKKDWPKTLDDYPYNHPPAQPPGCCSICSCMEDWHLGELPDKAKSWISDQSRDALAERAMQAFTDQSGLVRKRGAVSNMFFAEAGAGVKFQRLPEQGGDAQASFWALSKRLKEVAMQVAQAMPLGALKGPRGAQAMQCLGRLNGHVLPVSRDVEYVGRSGPYEPIQFEVGAGSPDWLTLSSSGEVIIGDNFPAIQPQKVPLTVSLTCEQPNGLPQQTFSAIVLPQDSSNGSKALETHTQEVVREVQGLPEPQRGYVEARLAPIFDFSAKQCRAAHLGTWLKAVYEASIMLQTAASANVVPSLGVEGGGGDATA